MTFFKWFGIAVLVVLGVLVVVGVFVGDPDADKRTDTEAQATPTLEATPTVKEIWDAKPDLQKQYTRAGWELNETMPAASTEDGKLLTEACLDIRDAINILRQTDSPAEVVSFYAAELSITDDQAGAHIGACERYVPGILDSLFRDR